MNNTNGYRVTASYDGKDVSGIMVVTDDFKKYATKEMWDKYARNVIAHDASREFGDCAHYSINLEPCQVWVC